MSHACPTEPPRPRGITTKDMQETYSTSRNGEFPSLSLSLSLSNNEKKGKKKNNAAEEKEEDGGPHNSPLHILYTSYAQLFVPRLFPRTQRHRWAWSRYCYPGAVIYLESSSAMRRSWSIDRRRFPFFLSLYAFPSLPLHNISHFLLGARHSLQVGGLCSAMAASVYRGWQYHCAQSSVYYTNSACTHSKRVKLSFVTAKCVSRNVTQVGKIH
jgi:hypothetical protein